MADVRMDARVDAMLRRLDGSVSPDDAFVHSSLADLLPRVRRARAADASPLGRWLRDFRLAAGSTWPPGGSRRLAVLAMTLLLAAILLIVLVFIVGSQRHVPPPFGPAANGEIAYDANGHVVIADADGANPRQITFDAGFQQDPAFSRDGTRLAWRQFDPSAPAETADVVLAEADGSNPITIARSVKGLSHVAWSPDGRFVAFSGSIEGGPGGAWVARSDGSSPPTQVSTVAGAWDPVWSPDGRQLVVGTDTASLLLVDRDGSNPRPLTVGPFKEVGQRGEVAEWNPDGTMVLFTALEPSGQLQVYIVGMEGERERRVSFGTAETREAVWSPDGSQIAYMRAGNGSGPVVVIADPTGKTIRVLPGAYGWYQPIWSPDGTKIVVTDDRPGPNNLDGPAIRVVLDVAGLAPPIEIPAPGVTAEEIPDWAATWQRLAP